MKPTNIMNLKEIRKHEKSARNQTVSNLVFFLISLFVCIFMDSRLIGIVILFGIYTIIAHIERRYWSTKYYQVKYFNWVKR